MPFEKMEGRDREDQGTKKLEGSELPNDPMARKEVSDLPEDPMEGKESSDLPEEPLAGKADDLPEDQLAGQDVDDLPEDPMAGKEGSDLPDDPDAWASSSIAPSSPEAEGGDKKLDLETQQKLADNCAKDYNEKYDPYTRAIKKGVDGIEKTKNGGVSFENSSALYKKEDGTKAIVRIEATGNRTADFNKANEKMGFFETPPGYVWHHVDDYDVKTNTFTLQLVKDEAHNVTKPHLGGCAQYDAVNGPSYNPPRKDV